MVSQTSSLILIFSLVAIACGKDPYTKQIDAKEDAEKAKIQAQDEYKQQIDKSHLVIKKVDNYNWLIFHNLENYDGALRQCKIFNSDIPDSSVAANKPEFIEKTKNLGTEFHLKDEADNRKGKGLRVICVQKNIE